jgi:hypothetical protein
VFFRIKGIKVHVLYSFKRKHVKINANFLIPDTRKLNPWPKRKPSKKASFLIRSFAGRKNNLNSAQMKLV